MEIYNNLYGSLEMVKIKWSCENFNFEEEFANEEQEVIERSRCIDYFIKLFSEITHPHRYRISLWVATINIRCFPSKHRF